MTVTDIHPKELAERKATGVICELIDVRSPGEYQGVHAEGARNVPLDKLDPRAVIDSRSTEQASEPLYVICHSGGRSRRACEQFLAVGFSNVVNVTGGTSLWESQGLPVIRSARQVMAIDRQVRIAAGLMVAVGALLALAEPTKWIGLGMASVVGLGLVHSGVTNTCGMASALAILPWNRQNSCAFDATTSN